MIPDSATGFTANLPGPLSSALITYVTQQTQGQGVCHVSPPGFECMSATLLSVSKYESRVRHLACEHARAHASASASEPALSDSVSEVQPGGGSL